MTVPEAAARPSEYWDEAQCTAALAQLERLQAEVNGLRLVIPRIIEPFHRPTNAAMFNLYKQGVITSQNDLKQFAEHWKDTNTRKIFEHVKESFVANTDLSASVSIPSHGWVEHERKEHHTKNRGVSDELDSVSSIITEEGVSHVIADFQKKYPSIQLDTEDDDKRISIQFTSGLKKLKFCVGVDRDASGRYRLTAECLGTAEPFLTISKCLATRPRSNDLSFTLDMIAAYKTVKGLSCARCGRLLDKFLLAPLARRCKPNLEVNDTTEIAWEALHEGCLS